MGKQKITGIFNRYIDWLDKVSISLNNPSKLAEIQELEHWSTKFEVAGGATEGYFSKRWIAKKIFNLSDEEHLQNLREMFFDKKHEAALEAAAEEDAAGAEGEEGGDMGGDMGGGGMYLAYGSVCALLAAQRTGVGQVVDAAMVDGAASLMAFFYGMLHTGFSTPNRGENMLDTGAHFYDVYECSDGEYITLGSIEPQFYAEMVEKLGLDPEDFADQHDRSRWPELKEKVAAVVATRTRDEWDAVLEGTDVCYAPVLAVSEAVEHPHNVARGTFVDIGGSVQVVLTVPESKKKGKKKP